MLKSAAERAADLLRGPERSNVRLLIAREDGTTFERVVSRRRVKFLALRTSNFLTPRWSRLSEDQQLSEDYGDRTGRSSLVSSSPGFAEFDH